MKQEITLAGFRGQGVLSMGLFLAHAAMTEKREVACLPAYGPEMWGGTANCTVSISDQEISSPLAAYSGIVVVMNHSFLEKFEPMVKTGGLLLINGSLVQRQVTRTDIESYIIPTQQLANQTGFSCGSNMVMLGALLEAAPLINNQNIYEYLIMTFKGKYLDKMPLNMAAVKAGMDYLRYCRKTKNRSALKT